MGSCIIKNKQHINTNKKNQKLRFEEHTYYYIATQFKNGQDSEEYTQCLMSGLSNALLRSK